MTNFRNHFNDEKDKKNKLLSRAWGYSELAMHKEAIAECEELVRQYPDDPSSFIELGLYYEESSEPEKAIECYKYAIKKFPEYSYLYLSLGYCFEKYKKCNDMAMLCYEKALQLNPDDEWALNNAAAMLQAEGKWKEAVVYYEKSYEAFKRMGMTAGQVMHNLAWAYYRLKEYKKAWFMFDRIAIEDSDYAQGKNDMYVDFGCVNYKMSHYKKALELIEKAISLQPDRKRYRRLWKVVVNK
jgi:tetratricopeptide (TPR) repeat protein